MATRLMGLELRSNSDPERLAELNYSYGRAMLNLRQIDEAKSFLEAASSAVPGNTDYQARFQETLYDRSNWASALENIDDQIKQLSGSDDVLSADVAGKGQPLSGLYLKAARILQQEAAEDSRLLPMLFKSLDANPLTKRRGSSRRLCWRRGAISNTFKSFKTAARAWSKTRSNGPSC